MPEGIPLSYALAGAVDLGPQPKQELLESRDEAERLVQLRRILRVAQDGIDRSRVAAERAQSNGKVIAPVSTAVAPRVAEGLARLRPGGGGAGVRGACALAVGRGPGRRRASCRGS